MYNKEMEQENSAQPQSTPTESSTQPSPSAPPAAVEQPAAPETTGSAPDQNSALPVDPAALVAPRKKGDLGVLVKKIFGNTFLHVSLQERVLFARHVAVGIHAGMSLQDSLKLVMVQTKSQAFKEILLSIINDTSNGMFLSAAMEKYPTIFGQLFINVVRVGEQSGTLTENLSYLAKELKKKQELVSKVRGALIYPAVIFFATIGIVVTLMVGVFPKILPVFANMKIKLPVTTKLLIATTNFFVDYGIWIAIGVIIFIFFSIWIARFEWFKHGWHHVLLRIPILGQIAVKVNMASISRVLGLLLKSGTQIIDSVNITSEAMDNRVYRHELRTAGETLRRGNFFSIYLSKYPKLFPPVFTNMVQVGENTGNLVENLEYLAAFYEEDVDEVLKNLNSIIEPFLLLFMGLLVGFIDRKSVV